MKTFFVLCLIFIVVPLCGQDITAEQLLEKTIAFHDPDNRWEKFKGSFKVTMSTPDKNDRVSQISIDLRKEQFELQSQRNEITLYQKVGKGTCQLRLNGNKEFSKEDESKYRLTCARAKMMKNYYTYLYGLPMKLRDPGTIIDPVVLTKEFKGKEYLILKVTYEQGVGKDIWYFYFDPATYAMEAYQFFHDESANDGEYILLSGIEEVSNIKMPKTRAWYYNKDEGYLGTDVLTN